MVQGDVGQWLKARSLREFDIITTAGEHHIVRHPEFAILSPTAMVVLEPTTDRFSFLARMHITEIRTTEAGKSEAASQQQLCSSQEPRWKLSRGGTAARRSSYGSPRCSS